MFALITIDETMDVQCKGITQSESKAKKMYKDYIKEMESLKTTCKVGFNKWTSKDGRDECVEVTINGKFLELMKLCKR